MWKRLCGFCPLPQFSPLLTLYHLFIYGIYLYIAFIPRFFSKLLKVAYMVPLLTTALRGRLGWEGLTGHQNEWVTLTGGFTAEWGFEIWTQASQVPVWDSNHYTKHVLDTIRVHWWLFYSALACSVMLPWLCQKAIAVWRGCMATEVEHLPCWTCVHEQLQDFRRKL